MNEYSLAKVQLLNPSQKDKTYFGRGIFWSGEHDLDWSNR